MPAKNPKEYKKEWNARNKAKRLEHKKIYESNNEEKVKAAKSKYSKIYRENNKESISIKKKKYRSKNELKIKEYNSLYFKERKKIDPLFKLRCNISSLISQSITKSGFKKNSKTHQILGCAYEEFKKHLEMQFEPWMSWNNYGKYNGTPNYGWDIDHIIPTASVTTELDLIKVNHYTNLQPLCSFNNRNIKRDKYEKGSR